MPAVGAEAELQTLTECRYSFPGQTLSDVQKVRAVFADLRLYVDFYSFPNKEKRRLVYLAGTVPVRYEGGVYHIPVCVWLHETHPVSRPRCCVCPSVSMMINPSCPCVDSSGTVSLDGLRTWTPGVSNLLLIVSEMRKNFQKCIPLYTRPTETAAAADTRAPQEGGSSTRNHIHNRSPHRAQLKAGQREGGRSYAEDLLGINFSPPSFSSSSTRHAPTSSSDLFSSRMEALKLDAQSESPTSQSAVDQCSAGPKPDNLHADVLQMASVLPPHQASVFLSLMKEGVLSWSPSDVLEAVQLNSDYQSALRFLSHCCPFCQEHVSFSKMVLMTHCSCFLCQSCFTSFFSAAIKERSVEQLVCPQCSQPDITGHKGKEVSVDYFNLLDTQIRHFLPSAIHELFQRKLRDRALLEMTDFCWCAHCSFGILHEVDRLRMDCPSCGKSTCSKCRAAWSPQHQGVSCDEFRERQQQTEAPISTTPLDSSIVCPRCHLVFVLSRGGCLHFTCSQCSHQFCGGCSRCFVLGPACSFSSDCANKGLHAHHPRDCLYHLRDWSVGRLLLLLQCYRWSPALMEAAGGGSSDPGLPAVCWVPELRDDGSRREQPCGRPSPPEYRGYCQLHYKERLVELVKRFSADPAILFTDDELVAELRRWRVSVPPREPHETEPLYTGRLRKVLTNSVPLRGSAPPC